MIPSPIAQGERPAQPVRSSLLTLIQASSPPPGGIR